jgi:hypothetical protein
VAGLKRAFKYDAGTHATWVTNMLTPYGTTAFRFGGNDVDSDGYTNSNLQINRFIEVTLPDGGHELYVFRMDCSDFMAQTNSTVPSTSPLANTLDNADHYYRNSFVWGPLQYVTLSTNNLAYLSATDYSLARMRHWLIDSITLKPAHVMSVEREPSPNGSDSGQLTWFDYEFK